MSDVQAQLKEGVALLQRGETAAAVQVFERLAAENRTSASLQTYLGYTYLLTQRWADAASAYERAVALDPQDVKARVEWSIALERLKRSHAVVDVLRPVIQSVGSDVDTLARYAYALFVCTNYAEARRAAEKVLEADPKNLQALEAAGVSAARMEDYDQSVRHLKSYAALRPDKARTLEQYAFSLAKSGKHDESQVIFGRLNSVLGASDDDDLAFHAAYNEAMIATTTHPTLIRRRRFHALWREVESCLDLPGTVAECGVLRGLSSHLICTRIAAGRPDFQGEGYFVFDSFEGLSEVQSEDTDGLEEGSTLPVVAGAYSHALEKVQENLSRFPEISYFKGWIPSRFNDVSDSDFRFVHVDVDLYQPTRDSLEFFYPRLVKGGKIVCDDYNWPGAKKAIDAFCSELGIRVRTTEHHQAIIVKG